mmetsp:Transcript_10580/g.31492  ORF Transcript_10580/g.31492 Transcript_10580/m.31492 type:complete len:219 (-) Transcript_10580:1866-2522(-)
MATCAIISSRCLAIRVAFSSCCASVSAERSASSRRVWEPKTPPVRERSALSTFLCGPSAWQSSSGVLPKASSKFGLTPGTLRRKLSAFTLEQEAATCRGLRPSLSCAFTSQRKRMSLARWSVSSLAAASLSAPAPSKVSRVAPWRSRSSQTSSSRRRRASCSGVDPRRSWALASALLWSSSTTLRTSPSDEAMCRGVRCSWSEAFTSLPCWQRRCRSS